MDTVLLQTMNTLSLGVTLMLVSMGLGVALSLMGVINLAHGEFLMLGAYTVYVANQIDFLPEYWFGLVIAPIVVGLIALVLEQSLIRFLYDRPLDTLLATWGVGIVIRELVALIFGAEQKALNGPFSGSLAFLGIKYPSHRVFMIIVGAAALAVFTIFFTRTSFGLRVRASIEVPDMAEAVGVNTRRIYTVAFALGAAIAGFAGALISPIYVTSPDMGLRWLVPAFLVVIIGGMGSVYGALIGGLLIAAFQAQLEYFVSISTAQLLVFVIAVVIVRMRPRGLLYVGV
jgi:urea ABC transporter permease protein UrtB